MKHEHLHVENNSEQLKLIASGDIEGIMKLTLYSEEDEE
jgi:hypothetical protein